MKRSPERIERVIQTLETGASLRAASAAAGIGEGTLRRWRADDEELAARIERARDVGEVALVGLIRTAAADDWRAAAWLLSHRWPDRWSEKRVISVEAQKKSDGTQEVLSMLAQIREPDEDLEDQEVY